MLITRIFNQSDLLQGAQLLLDWRLISALQDTLPRQLVAKALTREQGAGNMNNADFTCSFHGSEAQSYSELIMLFAQLFNPRLLPQVRITYRPAEKPNFDWHLRRKSVMLTQQFSTTPHGFVRHLLDIRNKEHRDGVRFCCGSEMAKNCRLINQLHLQRARYKQRPPN